MYKTSISKEITFRDMEITVDFTYYPGCPPVFYYPDGSGHPGDPPEIEILEVRYKNTVIDGIIEILGLWDELYDYLYNLDLDD